jgi:acetylornithine deacetylase/succinyl-diaminopimelate desuccinylase-like protein
MVLIEASEESGSPDLEAHLDALGAELNEVDLVVCLDSGALSYDRLWVTTSLRGCVVLSLEVAVLEHGVHSGEASGVVPSSFRLARQLLDRIEDPLTGELLLPELSVQIPEHHLAAAASLSGELGDPLATHFPTVAGLELMGRDGAERLVRQSWSAALSVTGVDGIPSVAEGGNVLRASTTLKLSVRIPPSVDAAVAQRALIAALVTEPPAGAVVKVAAGEPAQGWVAPTPARWLIDALDEASTEAFGRTASFLGEGGSIPFLSSLGTRFPEAQFVVTGVLGPDSNAHGPDESLHLPCCFGVTTAVAGVLAALARETERSQT